MIPRKYTVALAVGAVTSRTAPTDPRRTRTTATLLIENRGGWACMRVGCSRARGFPGPAASPFPRSIYYSNGAVILRDSDLGTGITSGESDEARTFKPRRGVGASMPRGGLDAIFSPSSIAIVGASRHRGKIGYEILHNLILNEYQGTVYPVNPKATSIHGIRAYPSVLEIPDRVDLAIITVPAEVALDAVEDCGKKGVKGLVVITAGFREIGEVGMAREARLLAVCDAYDMTMIGPNCMGVINTHPDIRMDATFAPTPPLPGGISLATQSGALGIAILDHAKSLGVGFAKFCSLGNKAQV